MKNKKIKTIVYDAMFLVLIILFTAVDYLGYINIGVVSFTTIHILVLIGAALFGWKRGTIYGFIMGVSSLIKAIQYPGTANYFFINPFISILPRVIFGLVSGFVFDLVRKNVSQKTYNYLVGPLSGILTLFHTVIVVLFWYAFGILDPFGISAALGLGSIIENMTFVAFIATFLVWGSLAEIAAAIIIVPVAYIPINKYFHIGGVSKKIEKKAETPIPLTENSNFIND